MATAYRTTGGREMSVGSVLSRAFGALGAAPVLFFGLSFLLAALPLTLLTLAAERTPRSTPATDLATLSQMLPLFLGGGLVWTLVYLAAKALLIRAAVAEIDGEPKTVGALAGGAIRVVLPLFGLSILFWLAVWFGTLLLLIPGILLATIWAVAGPALIVERTGVFAAFGRSAALTRGARWRVLGLVVLVFAIYFVASMMLGMVGGVATLTVGAGASFASTLISAALQTAFTAVWSAVQAALYAELRDWKDGPAGDRLADIFA